MLNIIGNLINVFKKASGIILEWILARGFWEDAGIWDDVDTWND